MVFNVEDRILVKIYINSKATELKNSKFPDKGWTVNGLSYLLKKLRNIATTARQPEVDDVIVSVQWKNLIL